MGAAYSAADLALCRGGAATVAELWLHRLPAVVVPYPGHADRQQELNARALEPGVRVLDDGAAVRAAVLELLDDAGARRAMSASLAASAPPDGLAQAVGMLEEMAARFA
jgi:UDP-N-acetylglucosamine--N-acetylmuramyl-(pentapeptide) pyrophosphoryl-undecaprenol N-acetylglucosamine transferase